MTTYRLNISIVLDYSEDEADVVLEAKDILNILHDAAIDEDKTKVSLTRDGDRAGLNLLLPKVGVE